MTLFKGPLSVYLRGGGNCEGLSGNTETLSVAVSWQAPHICPYDRQIPTLRVPCEFVGFTCQSAITRRWLGFRDPRRARVVNLVKFGLEVMNVCSCKGAARQVRHRM